MSAEGVKNEESGESKPDITGSAAVFTPISPPTLESTDPVEICKFLKKRDKYVREVNAKRREVPSLTVTPLKACIDRPFLEDLVYMQELEKIAPGKSAEELTDEDLDKYLRSVIDSVAEDYDPRIIETALEGLKFPSEIGDPKQRIANYCSRFFERLRGIGCQDIRDDNPKQTIHLLLRKVQPPALKTRLQELLRYDLKAEKSVPRFIQKMKELSAAYHAFPDRGRSSKKDTSEKNGVYKGGRRADNGGSSSNSGRNNGVGSSARKERGDRPVPVCLWPEHKAKGIKHWLEDCPDCPAHERRKLKEEWFKEKKQSKQRANRTASKAKGTKSSSVAFSANFGATVQATICADIGADGNIMDENLLKKIEEAGETSVVEVLDSPVVFAMAAHDIYGQESKLVCDRAVTVDTELHIRHGTGLTLRNTRWLVSKQRLHEPLLGRPTLERLGLNTADILASAADKFTGSVDLAEIAHMSDTDTNGRVARVMQGVFHADGDETEDNCSNFEKAWCDLGPEEESKWEQELSARLEATDRFQFSKKGKQRLEKMLRERRDIVRIRLDGRPPARVEAQKISIMPGAAPVYAKPRRYPPEKRDFLRKYVGELQKMGFVKIATNTEWVSPPLVVPKKPPANFRMTMDYRAVNAVTVKTTWPMPHIDAAVAELAGAQCFAGLDFCSGYWQLPLHPESQALYAFLTPDGVMQPTRTTQGACNSAANFQKCVEPCFAELRGNMLAWLDDFVLYAKSEDKLLDILERFLEICEDRNLVVSIKKSEFFTREIEWCGRILDADGIRMNPASYAGMTSACRPRTGAELSQYVHCSNWMREAIPRFAERIAPLRKILEKAYDQAGKRTTKGVAKIKLDDIGWGQEETNAFYDIQTQLIDSTKISYRDATKSLCVYTDASDAHWAAAITQCTSDEIRKPVMEQQHQPLAFLGGSFTGAQEHCSTYEKEAFEIVEAFRKQSHLFACDDTTTVFTDHRNLLFVFHPTAIEPNLGRHKVLKVIRWALFLSSFCYVIVHVPGDENIIGDPPA